jgi:hypothetical protein
MDLVRWDREREHVGSVVGGAQVESVSLVAAAGVVVLDGK